MGNARILIVDNEPQIRRVMRTTLIAEGFEVADARCGDEALDRMRESRYDLVLLDINMPGISGIDTCRAIRGRSEVPIIMLTVRDAARDKVEALEAGADDYVTKPFSTPELIARIHAALRRKGSSSGSLQSVLELDGVEIDLDARQVRAPRGKSSRLTLKEFELLSYLVSHANKTLSHGDLLRAVWGPDYDEEYEYLRVFVNRLRKKIERTPANPQYLLTEPWVGYRLRLPK